MNSQPSALAPAHIEVKRIVDQCNYSLCVYAPDTHGPILGPHQADGVRDVMGGDSDPETVEFKLSPLAAEFVPAHTRVTGPQTKQVKSLSFCYLNARSILAQSVMACLV